ncbi:neutral/alkaline non-lysosomal ceramidase N-terminal domain-containing protein [Membranihabitans maritimus]|uniref:neutral/alkaline non-lysosomal ceramidase N-terminal domain-containing protein n=1 Tax=Membranihabitans maritimus TaxID=2904244 RepID=UPI001F340EA4|nr:neutral/alkaline non-lysosomal ceramidase N-terminal domain-containing protein [Membranihabitans maritimus]
MVFKMVDLKFNSFKWNTLIYSMFIIFFIAQGSKAQNNSFNAGASIVDITPFLGHRVVGGYNSPIATYIHDPLQVRTLVLDDGIQKLFFVIVDNVSVGKEVFDAAKIILAKEYNIHRSHVLMAATHTHSAVSLRGVGNKLKEWRSGVDLDEYQTFVVKRIVDGVHLALKNCQLARIGIGSIDVPEHVFNRRWIMKDSVMSPLGQKEIVRMNPGHSADLLHPAGPVDPEVSFLAIESIEGKPIGLLANYSLHYVGGVPQGHISADYFAAFADRMMTLLEAEKQIPSFVGIMTNGTSGDINNNDYSKLPTRLPNYEKIKYVADDVADKVFEEYQKLTFEDEVVLGSKIKEMSLKVRRADPQVLVNMAAVRSYNGDIPMFHRLEKVYMHRIFDMEAEYPDSVHIELQAFSINDIGIAAIPFEVFAEIGLEIKSSSPYKDTFVIGLANGAFGYLPTPEQHRLGGYETWQYVNKVEKTASDKIEKEILNLFETMH